jgi:hypothetical protein
MQAEEAARRAERQAAEEARRQAERQERLRRAAEYVEPEWARPSGACSGSSSDDDGSSSEVRLCASVVSRLYAGNSAVKVCTPLPTLLLSWSLYRRSPPPFPPSGWRLC